MPRDTPAAFFSYCREDSEFALRLAEDLKAVGANVWIDQLDIEPGTPWDRAVEDALIKCPRMLVILSPVSVTSDNVRDEVSFALSKQKKIIPVLYRDCDVPFRVARLQHIDFRADYDRALKTLLKVLGLSQPVAIGDASVPAFNKGAHPALPDSDGRRLAGEQIELEVQRPLAAERERHEQKRRQAAEQFRLEKERKHAAERARLQEDENLGPGHEMAARPQTTEPLATIARVSLPGDADTDIQQEPPGDSSGRPERGRDAGSALGPVDGADFFTPADGRPRRREDETPQHHEDQGSVNHESLEEGFDASEPRGEVEQGRGLFSKMSRGQRLTTLGIVLGAVVTLLLWLVIGPLRQEEFHSVTLAGHTSPLFSVAFSPDGSRIVTAGDDGARVWHGTTGTLLAVLTGHTPVAITDALAKELIVHAEFSPDGRFDRDGERAWHCPHLERCKWTTGGHIVWAYSRRQ